MAGFIVAGFAPADRNPRILFVLFFSVFGPFSVSPGARAWLGRSHGSWLRPSGAPAPGEAKNGPSTPRNDVPKKQENLEHPEYLEPCAQTGGSWSDLRLTCVESASQRPSSRPEPKAPKRADAPQPHRIDSVWLRRHSSEHMAPTMRGSRGVFTIC